MLERKIEKETTNARVFIITTCKCMVMLNVFLMHQYMRIMTSEIYIDTQRHLADKFENTSKSFLWSAVCGTSLLQSPSPEVCLLSRVVAADRNSTLRGTIDYLTEMTTFIYSGSLNSLKSL